MKVDLRNKPSTITIILVTILLVVFLPLGGYLLYNSILSNINIDESVMSLSDARKLAQEKYQYALDTSLGKKFTYDSTVVNDMVKITNFEDVATNFTTDYQNDKHYNGFNVFCAITIRADGRYIEPNFTNNYNFSKKYIINDFTPMVITKEAITYSVSIDSYNEDNSKGETYYDMFILKRIDSIWKIDSYEFKYIDK